MANSIFSLYPYHKTFKLEDYTLFEMSKDATYCSNLCFNNVNNNGNIKNNNLEQKYKNILNVENTKTPIYNSNNLTTRLFNMPHN